MAKAGKSLVGFMDQQFAIQYLRNSCAFATTLDDVALDGIWQTAKAKLGTPTAKAGMPDIQDIPASHTGYVTNLMSQPYLSNAWGTSLAGSAFKLIEIEPLLAFQFSIDNLRSDHHCTNLANPPTLDELLEMCLPLVPPMDPISVAQGPQSMLITSRSLNFRPLAQGFINGCFVGMQVGMGLPLAHVVRLNGKCYLHNGFHRAYGARAARATHIPCVFRDVTDAASAGIVAGSTFELPLLESNNPPTLAHYTQDRAQDVDLRVMTRTIHVSWADYVTPAD